jgi:L-ascorbate metabolism protein UlaG (beta-lactamase superfamily)
MDIQFYGGNCLVLSSKQTRLVVDDTLAELGAKSIAKEGDICLFTGAHKPVGVKAKIVVDMPGEYEVSNVSVFGLQTRSHLDEEKQKNATVYKITWGDLRVAVVGHIYPKLTEAQLEELGTIDVLCIPVGGNGYTLDGTGALEIIKEIEPKLVVPTHYADASLKFEVPQQTLEEAIKALGMEPREPTKKLQLKHSELPASTQLVILEKV